MLAARIDRKRTMKIGLAIFAIGLLSAFFLPSIPVIIGIMIVGGIIDLTGRNYNMIFIVCPIFFVLAFLSLSGVTRGESKLS